jgi:hypothetical protein
MDRFWESGCWERIVEMWREYVNIRGGSVLVKGFGGGRGFFLKKVFFVGLYMKLGGIVRLLRGFDRIRCMLCRYGVVGDNREFLNY